MDPQTASKNHSSGTLYKIFAEAPKLANLMQSREWQVLRVDEGAGDLICGDEPVCLWQEFKQRDNPSIDFDTPRSSVYMPIGPRAALFGTLGGRYPVTRMDDEVVAHYNYQIANAAERFIIVKDTFSIQPPGRPVLSHQEFCKEWFKDPPVAP